MGNGREYSPHVYEDQDLLEARRDALRVELDEIAVELDGLPDEDEAPADPTPEDSARSWF